MTPFVLNCHTVWNRHLEVCLQCSRLLNDNSKLKSDDYTLWLFFKNALCNFLDTTPGKFIKKFEYSPQDKENVSNFKSLNEVSWNKQWMKNWSTISKVTCIYFWIDEISLNPFYCTKLNENVIWTCFAHRALSTTKLLLEKLIESKV